MIKWLRKSNEIKELKIAINNIKVTFLAKIATIHGFLSKLEKDLGLNNNGQGDPMQMHN